MGAPGVARGGLESPERFKTSSSGWRSKTRDGVTRESRAPYRISDSRSVEIPSEGSSSSKESILPAIRSTTWSTFLAAHWGAIAATDFFSVEVITWRGLVRYMVLFLIDLKTRRIEIAGVVAFPDGLWMSQIARNLTDCDDGFLRQSRFLIHDRDPLFTRQFRTTLREAGTEPIRLPSRSPNLNAYAERFVRSIKSECLGQVIPLGERHLRSLVLDFTDTITTSEIIRDSGIGSLRLAPRTSADEARSSAGRGVEACFDRADAGLVAGRHRAARCHRVHQQDAAHLFDRIRCRLHS
jgi:transposase InsO family protein